MDEYKPNSHKYRTEQNDLKSKKIVSGEVKIMEHKPGIKGVFDDFFKEDAPTVRKYLIYSVLIPAIKKTLYELINNGARMSLFGEKGSVSDRRKEPYGMKYSYSKYYEDDDRRPEPRYKERPSYDNIVLDNAGDAEAILDALQNVIDEYGSVSILQLFDMLGKDCDYTQDRYGWTDLSNSGVRPVEDGYWLKLPKPRPIK